MIGSRCTSLASYLLVAFTILEPCLVLAQTGAGNEEAIRLAAGSPLVRSAERYLLRQVERLRNQSLRVATLDALGSKTCVQHRATLSDADKDAIVEQLRAEGLLSTADAAVFPGGAKAGVFPALLEEGSDCPRLPQTFSSAPGSVYGGHHSFTGGLVVHEAFNEISNQHLAAGYRRVYGTTERTGFPSSAAETSRPTFTSMRT
jgi:hypothetical protein